MKPRVFNHALARASSLALASSCGASIASPALTGTNAVCADALCWLPPIAALSWLDALFWRDAEAGCAAKVAAIAGGRAASAAAASVATRDRN